MQILKNMMLASHIMWVSFAHAVLSARCVTHICPFPFSMLQIQLQEAPPVTLEFPCASRVFSIPE